uniref:Uncharacterized protein n=1 Tax=Picea sitchensis TaxID=3332 RepID=A9NY75_PICSI|nr:unknown [Picea sitchensis]
MRVSSNSKVFLYPEISSSSFSCSICMLFGTFLIADTIFSRLELYIAVLRYFSSEMRKC